MCDELPGNTDTQNRLRSEIALLPFGLRDDARQEAWLAHLEGRDPVLGVWAISNRERAYAARHIQGGSMEHE